MSWRALRRPHFEEIDSSPPPRRLPGGLAAGETGADDRDSMHCLRHDASLAVVFRATGLAPQPLAGHVEQAVAPLADPAFELELEQPRSHLLGWAAEGPGEGIPVERSPGE